MNQESDEEKDVFAGHPYSSPSESSDNDDKDSVLELDFAEFGGPSNESEPQTFPSIIEDPFGAEDELPEWCSCGNCSINCPLFEAVCCNNIPEVSTRLQSEGDCIIDHDFFANIVSDEGLQYSRSLEAAGISNHSEKRRYLSEPFAKNLRRSMAYRNFLIWINQNIPMGRGIRMVLPRCVVLKIRQLYPDQNHHYTGFRPSIVKGATG